MHNGGHSRHTYPFDKPTPKETLKLNRGFSLTRQTAKKLQKRKQRQHDRKLCKEIFEIEIEEI